MDLKQLLDQHGIRYVEGGSHRNVREGWLGLDCPWCGTAGKFHLGIHPDTLRGFCWQCGSHNFVEAFALIARMPIGQAWVLVKDLPRHFKTIPKTLSWQGKLRVPSGLQQLTKPHRKWLRNRGLDPDLLEKFWVLQGIEISSRLGWSIWVPVHLNGKVVSWTTRSIGNGETRWTHARPEEEVIPIKSLLYGWDYVRSSVVIVEGASDVWRIGPGAVAIFGMMPTVQQIYKLASIPLRVICLDKQPKAQRAAAVLAKQLQLFPGTTIVAELESDDPGSATDKEVAELRKFLEQ